MKKKRYTRPVSVVLPEKVFDMIRTITTTREISISDYIREALEKHLTIDDTTPEGGQNHER
jgi:Arc/MetJ-type ribon-helix-helix transcriptional regulator